MEARKRSLILILLLLVSFNSVLVFLPQAKSSGPPLTVGGPEPDSYPTIQSAIDAAIEYDSIVVYPGTYEETLTINKTVSIYSWDPQNTTIIGDGKGDVINITGVIANLQGFTIRNSGPEGFGAGIVLYDTGMCSIYNVDASQNYYYGIVIYSSSWNQIRYNNFSNVGPPSSGLKGWGIYVHSSSHNNVSSNTVLNNSVGIALNSSDSNTIGKNTLSDNHYGLRGEGDENRIANNLISSNDWGIVLHGENNSFAENTIKGNVDGILLGGSYNKLFHNSFIENWRDATEGGTDNQWDNGYPQGGNYWDRHTSVDEKKDGISELPVIIEGTVLDFETEDRYPLVSPFVAPPSPTGNILPEVSITWPSSGTQVSGLITITGNASDTDGDVEALEVRWRDLPWIEADGTTAWEFELGTRSIDNGNTTLYFRSFDGISYSNETSLTVEIDNPYVRDPSETLFWALNGAAVILVIAVVSIYAARKKK
jgi:parallel beta-helix repeat protein